MTGHYNETTHTAGSLDATVSAGGTASATCATVTTRHRLLGRRALRASTRTYPPSTAPPTARPSHASSATTTSVRRAAPPCRACGLAWSRVLGLPLDHQLGSAAWNDNAAGTHDFDRGLRSSGIGCHSTYDVHALHKNAAGGCAISGCHDFTAQGANPALKACGEVGGCHATAGTDYHVDQTAKHTSGTVVSCFGTSCHATSRSIVDVHARYVGEGSPNPQYSTTCDLCHRNATAGRIDWATATDECVSCHGAYHGVPAGQPVMHQDRDAAHEYTAASDECTVCHSGRLVEIHGGIYYEPAGCGSCHSVHSSISRGCEKCHSQVNNWTSSAECSNCHDRAIHAEHGTDASHTATPFTAEAQGTGVDGTVPAEGKQCSICHSATLKPAHSTVSVSGGSVTCMECHQDAKLGSAGVIDAGWTTSRCTQCHDTGTARTHGAYDTTHTVSTTRGCAGSGADCHDYTNLAKLHDKSQSGGQPRGTSHAPTSVVTPRRTYGRPPSMPTRAVRAARAAATPTRRPRITVTTPRGT